MIAYKFLAPGAVGPFSRFGWPVPDGAAPGAWVEGGQRPGRGVHACRPGDLAFWLDAELWRAELADPVVEARHQVIGWRGRLLERVRGWTPEAASALAEAGVWRARDLALAALRAAGQEREADLLARAGRLAELGEAAKGLAAAAAPASALAAYLVEAVATSAQPAVCTYIAARCAGAARGDEGAFAAERAEQGRWLAQRLGLS